MPEFTLTRLLLSSLVGAERAMEIEGDFIEEYPRAGMLRRFTLLLSVFSAFVQFRFSQAPWRSVGLGLLIVFLIYLLTTLLLTPLILKSVDVREWAFISVIYMFRGVACFVIGVFVHEYARRHALSGLICAVFLLAAIMFFKILLLSQGQVHPGPVTFDVFQNVFFYLLFSIFPLMCGFLYGHYVKCCAVYYRQQQDLSDAVMRQS